MKAAFIAFALAAVAAANTNGTTTSLTTSVVYATEVHTITACPSTVTDCPARSTPVVVTSTKALYTTICPVGSTPTPESSPKYTVPATPATSTKKVDVTTVTVYNCPATYTPTKPATSVAVVCPGGDKCPVPTPSVVCPAGGCPSKGAASPSASATPTKTNPGQVPYTGAASAHKVGGIIMAAGLAAALL